MTRSHQRSGGRLPGELQSLIAHCLDDAGGLTPSDFPLARLNRAQLDALAGSGQAH